MIDFLNTNIGGTSKLMLISRDDSDLLRFRWRIGRDGYAHRTTNAKIDGIKVTVDLRIHRIVLSRIIGRPLTSTDICDHVNGTPLDNRRENLRLTDLVGNGQNRTSLSLRKKFGHSRGVTFHTKAKKWQATVQHNGRNIYLGLFNDELAAARVAADKRRELGFLGATQ